VLKISPVSRNDKDRTFTSTKGGNIAVTEIKQTVKKEHYEYQKTETG